MLIDHSICVICNCSIHENILIGNVGMITKNTPVCEDCLNSNFKHFRHFKCTPFCWLKSLMGTNADR